MKDQHSFKIFYVKLEEDISTNVNNVWETEGYTPISCKLLLSRKKLHSFDDLSKCFKNVFKKKNPFSSPSKNLEVYDVNYFSKKKYPWIDVINHLHRFNLVIIISCNVRKARHLTTKYI